MASPLAMASKVYDPAGKGVQIRQGQSMKDELVQVRVQGADFGGGDEEGTASGTPGACDPGYLKI